MSQTPDLNQLVATLAPRLLQHHSAVPRAEWGIPDLEHLVTGTDDLRVPAACCYPQQGLIVVHQAIPSMKPPKYVLNYLVGHELLHFEEASRGNGCAHDQRFRFLEKARIPHTHRAKEWLSRHNFPVVPS